MFLTKYGVYAKVLERKVGWVKAQVDSFAKGREAGLQIGDVVEFVSMGSACYDVHQLNDPALNIILEVEVNLGETLVRRNLDFDYIEFCRALRHAKELYGNDPGAMIANIEMTLFVEHEEAKAIVNFVYTPDTLLPTGEVQKIWRDRWSPVGMML